VLVNTRHKVLNLAYTLYMKVYVRLVDLELHFPNTLTNAKMTYVSNVDLNEWTNFDIHDFSS